MPDCFTCCAYCCMCLCEPSCSCSLQHPNSFCARLEPSVYTDHLLSVCSSPLYMWRRWRQMRPLFALRARRWATRTAACFCSSIWGMCAFPGAMGHVCFPPANWTMTSWAWWLSLWPFRERCWEHKRAGYQQSRAADHPSSRCRW